MNGNKTIVFWIFFLMSVFVSAISISAVDDIDWNVITTTGGGNSSNITTQIFPFNWSNNTYVGIGTNNPIYPLHVVGNSYLGNLQLSGSFNSDLYLPTNKIKIGDSASVNKLDVFGGGMTVSSNTLYSRNSVGSGILLVENKIGIGTTNPLKMLHVGAGADTPVVTANGLTIQNAGATALTVIDATNNVESFLYAATSVGIVGTSTNHAFRIRTNNTDRINVDNAGKVGIGTTSPDGDLSILSDTTNRLFDIGNSGTRKLNVQWIYNGNGSLQYADISTQGGLNNINLQTGGGNVGIGTASPNTLLDVNGIIRTRAASKGTCDSNSAGAIAYEVFNSTGNFYGCRQTNSTSYSWALLN